MKVFIQNEAGSRTKHHYNEKTLKLRRTTQVSLPYPFPYGFVLATTAEDGCNVDCFVLTRRKLLTGKIVDCEAIALMEQFEDGREDHNVLAALRGESPVVDKKARKALTEFVNHVFDHVPGKQIRAGGFRNAEIARQHVTEHIDTKIAHRKKTVKSG